MGTIALLNHLPADRADAWHRVRSPGGYEWWHFDVLLEENVRVSVDFFDGCPFHPEYLRRYQAYLAHPTRTAPPVGSDYRCVGVKIADRGKLLGWGMTRYDPACFEASENECRVRIGGNAIEPGEGRFRVRAGLTDQGISADLVFFSEPGDLRVRKPVSREMTGADHYWMVSAPCAAAGTVRLRKGREITARGRGYHDHRYGTGPIGAGIRRLMIGHASAGERTITFELAESENPAVGEEQKIFTLDGSGTREAEMGTVDARWGSGSWTPWGIAYPIAMDLGQSLILREPRVLQSDASRVWVEYDAFLDGEKGEAVCEIIYPGRLSGKFIGRWIERGIGFCARE